MKVTNDGDGMMIMHHIIEMFEADFEKMAEDNGIDVAKVRKMLKNLGEAKPTPGEAVMISVLGVLDNLHNASHDLIASPNIGHIQDKSLRKSAIDFKPHLWDEINDEQRIKYKKALGKTE